jgi:DNA-binding GntR family transcriptional regulator
MELTAVQPAVGEEYDDDLEHPNKYVRLAAEIRALVEAGRLLPGDPVPSIAALTAERGWARQTCAKALRLLTEEGVLTLFPGSGYHVTRPSRNGKPRNSK